MKTNLESVRSAILFRGGYRELRYLKANEGKIYILYKIILREKEITKLKLFGMVGNIIRGKKVRGGITNAYRTLKVLNVLEDNNLKMDDCKVHFVREFSIKEINNLLNSNPKKVRTARE